MDYPLFLPSFGGGILIAIVSILHVLVSHFAVGGGIALGVLEYLSVKRTGNKAYRDAAKRGSKMLILVSTVFGALSGVGIWFTIGVISPAGTADLIRLFVWVWAIEWAFFLLEIVTALLYYATWEKVSPKTHLLLIGLYAFSAYMSLVVIQGILSFMLTPGSWPTTGSILDAFFNPTYLPGLVFRTGVCLLLAGAYLMLSVFSEKDRLERARLVRLLGAFEAVGLVLSGAGYLLWERALDTPLGSLFLGAKPLLPGLALSRKYLLWAGAVCLVLALAALVLPKLQNWPAAVAALLAGFAVLAGYERVREGVRKPYIIRPHVFSNGLAARDIDALNEGGLLTRARWAKTGTEASVPAALQTGAAVFRSQCAPCHTINGYLGIKKLTAAADVDIMNMILTAMKDDGEKRKRIARGEPVQPDYILMPPFVGTEAEKEALAQYLVSLQEAGNAH